MQHLPLHRYCHFCASPLPLSTVDGQFQECKECGTLLYYNPIPAALALIPEKQSMSSQPRFLAVQRAIEPASGFWALPGGYIDCMETAETACRRELFEETQIDALTIYDPKVVGTLLTRANHLLIFHLYPPMATDIVAQFKSNNESLDCQWRSLDQRWAFELHKTAITNIIRGSWG